MSLKQEMKEIDSEVLCSIMSTVYYFDIFRHPLRQNELLRLSHYRKISPAELSASLRFLVNNNFLFEHNDFFLPNKSFENILRRLKGEMLSEKFRSIAAKKSAFISSFPFVKSVMISGSLSKGYMDENSDIDYLIITKPGRLWVARTLLVLYKKIFLLNSHKFFCVNYFLDLNNLELNDRNIFTATELLFALPMYNAELYDEFLNSNGWAIDYYPGFERRHAGSGIIGETRPLLKKVIENTLNGKSGEYLDSVCMKISHRFWNYKFRKMKREQFQRDMKSTRGISKHHPNGFRDSILNEHNHRMKVFRQNLASCIEFEEVVIPTAMHS